MKKDEKKEGVGAKASNFLADVAAEARKTTWPHREELIQSTIVVIVTIGMLGLFVWLSDGVLSALINSLTRVMAKG